MNYTDHFHSWLENQRFPVHMGQVILLKGYRLRHRDDSRNERLKSIQSLEEWHELIRFNKQGKYRPLKASPDLKSGWEYGPLDFPGLILALQYLYPGAVANWTAFQQRQLPVVNYAHTAARQSGMFAVVKKLSVAEQKEVVAEVCAPNCLKRRVWFPGNEIVQERIGSTGDVPLLCTEACNFFVNAARQKITGAADQA